MAKSPVGIPTPDHGGMDDPSLGSEQVFLGPMYQGPYKGASLGAYPVRNTKGESVIDVHIPDPLGLKKA